MQAPALVMPSNDPRVNEQILRKAAARRLVDRIFKLEPGTPARWRAIEAVWLTIMPQTHGYAKKVAMQEAADARATLLDKKFGQSAATLNKGKTADGKHVQNLRVIGTMPTSLRALLNKFDPLGLGMATGKENRLMRRKLYNEFKEYKIPEFL